MPYTQSSRLSHPRTRLHSRYEHTGPCRRIHWLTSQTLTAFLDAALTKKYTNPSSDIIAVLAGLNNADTVMTDFIATLDTVIRTGRTCMFMSSSSILTTGLCFGLGSLGGKFKCLLRKPPLARDLIFSIDVLMC